MAIDMNDVFSKLHTQLKSQKGKYDIYMRYYKGRHRVDSNGWDTRSNIKEIHNYCKLFIDDNTGFLLGVPPKLQYTGEYTSGDYTIVEEYNRTLDMREQQINQKLLRDMQIFGKAYEINYTNKSGEFDVAIKTPLDVSVLREGNKVLYGLLDKGISELDNDIENYTMFLVREGMILDVQYNASTEKVHIGKQYKNLINNPIIVVMNNWEGQSEIEDIIPLNDSYNQVSSDATSEINDFRNAYLHFAGATLDEEILRRMNNSGIISTDVDTKVSFITKDVNTEFIGLKLKQIEENMYDIAGQVNFNDTNLGSNTSSLALRNKLTKLINKLKLKEGFLREAFTIRLKNLSEFILSTNRNANEEFMDYSKVEVTFTFNIPTNDKEVAEMVIGLHNAGLISKESAISQLSFIGKTQDELERIASEQEDTIDYLGIFGGTQDE